MQTDKHCLECQATLSNDTPDDRCPQCRSRRGVSTISAQLPESEVNETAAYVGPAPLPSAADLAGHFGDLEVLELLGQGGMGAVYKARQLSLDRVVALKIVRPGAGRALAFAERFAREARALARLTHQNIVAIYEFGETKGLHYLLMEFVDGTNLRQLIRAEQISPRYALSAGMELCDALQYAHDEGVVHRDIKPENILADRIGRVKLADFGLAKLGSRVEELALTGSEQVMGTPRYMAPEQIEKPLEVDHRADIYALGVVLYEMLTGELPLGRFGPPSQKVGVDRRVDAVVLRALEKDPSRRYQEASALRADLEPLVGNSAASTLSLSLPKVAAGSKIEPAQGRPRWLQVLRRRPILWSGAAVLAVVILIIAIGQRQKVQSNSLVEAARNGDLASVQAWLRSGTPVDERKDGYTGLIEAAYQGHEAVADTLLKQGAQINARHSTGGWTPLQMAAKQGHSAIVDMLLAKGADVNAQDNLGQTSLHPAAAGGHYTIVHKLLAAGAGINLPDNDGTTPLMFAVALGRSAVAELLVERGAQDSGSLALQHGYQLAVANRPADALAYLKKAMEARTQQPQAKPWCFRMEPWQYQIANPQVTLLALIGDCHARCGQNREAQEQFAACLKIWPEGTKDQHRPLVTSSGGGPSSTGLILYSRVHSQTGETIEEAYVLTYQVVEERARNPAASCELQLHRTSEQSAGGSHTRGTTRQTISGLIH